MSTQLILLVDDEVNITELAGLYLKRDGYEVKAVHDGLAAMDALEKLQPALVVLDLMLPELDGLEICKRVRAANNQVPILMLTAKDDDIDKIIGLELGADDYLTKPFNPRELVSRVKAVLRRSLPQENSAQSVIRLNELVIYPDRREVTYQGKNIDLRTQEFEVLMVLAENSGKVFSRERLLLLAWGYDFYGNTRTVDVHIAQLRRKFKDSNVRIETVIGVGYKLVS